MESDLYMGLVHFFATIGLIVVYGIMVMILSEFFIWIMTRLPGGDTIDEEEIFSAFPAESPEYDGPQGDIFGKPPARVIKMKK